MQTPMLSANDAHDLFFQNSPKRLIYHLIKLGKTWYEAESKLVYLGDEKK